MHVIPKFHSDFVQSVSKTCKKKMSVVFGLYMFHIFALSAKESLLDSSFHSRALNFEQVNKDYLLHVCMCVCVR